MCIKEMTISMIDVIIIFRGDSVEAWEGAPPWRMPDFGSDRHQLCHHRHFQLIIITTIIFIIICVIVIIICVIIIIIIFIIVIIIIFISSSSSSFASSSSSSSSLSLQRDAPTQAEHGGLQVSEKPGRNTNEYF